MTVFARLASGQGYARAALLNLSLCLAFLLVGSSEAASSSSSSTETGMVGGNHSNATMGHGLHPHAAGGQGEIHFICFVLFAGFLFIKGKNKIICCKNMVPYTVQLLLLGLCIGIIHEATLHDYNPKNKKPFPSGCVDTSALTCTSYMTGSFFKFEILESVDPHAVMFIFLPPLIFESAFYADAHIFIKSFKTIVSMAAIGVIIASCVTMLLIMGIFPVYKLNPNIDYSIYGATPTILPAMLLGVTLSATDPVAVVSLLNSLGAPKQLGTMIEGESLLNDGTAYGLFLLILRLMRSYYANLETPHLLCDKDPNFAVGGCVEGYLSAGETIGFFINLILVAGIIGSVIGTISRYTISMIYDNKMQECLLTLLAAYSSWIVAEAIAASGVLAVVACGIIMGMHKENISPSSREFIEEFWETVCYILNTILFVMTGVIIGVKLTMHGTHFEFGSDLLLMIFVYFSIHIARGLSILALQPCLNKSGSIRCCKGKYATYDFDNTHSIVMWWGGLRGAVGLALGLIVSSDELWKEMDDAYCNKHGCCGDGTASGGGECWMRKRHYQTAFGDIFLIHVSFIVFTTIVINGVSTGTLVKRLGLSKKESKLDHLNFNRICMEIDDELKERKEFLQKEDIVHAGSHTKKGGYHADWNIVYRYLPIPTKAIYKARLAEGTISSAFGSPEDLDMPPRLVKRWRRYHQLYGDVRVEHEELNDRERMHKIRSSATNAADSRLKRKKSNHLSEVVTRIRGSSRRKSVVDMFSEDLENKLLAHASSSKRNISMNSENKKLIDDALVLADLRVKYANMVIEKYWHLVSEGYLQMESFSFLKDVEELQKDIIDDTLATLSNVGMNRKLSEEEKDEILAGGQLVEFTKYLQKSTEPWPILIFAQEMFKWLPPIHHFISSMLSALVTKDYSMVESFAHAHTDVQHELYERHEGAIEDSLLMRIIEESNVQIAEAVSTLEGLSEAYEKIIERHQTMVAAEVMLENHKMLVREKEEEGEIDADMAHKLMHMINISHKKLKWHPYPTQMASTLKDHINKAVTRSPMSNMVAYCYDRMDQETFQSFAEQLILHTNQSPIYLKAYELVYMKGKPDLHLGVMSSENLGLYLILKGKVSVVYATDDVEEDFEEREKHYHEILKRTARENAYSAPSSPNGQSLQSITEDLSVTSLSDSQVDLKELSDKPSQIALTKGTFSRVSSRSRSGSRMEISEAFFKWLKSKPDYEQPESIEELKKALNNFKRQYRNPRTVEKAMAQTAFLTMNRTYSKQKNLKSESQLAFKDAENEKKNIYNHLRAITKSRGSEEKSVTEIETLSSYQTFGEYELNGDVRDRVYTAICDSPCLLYYIERVKLDKLRKKFKILDDYLIMRALWSNANLYLREAFALKPPLAAAFDNFLNGKIYHGKPGTKSSIIDIPEKMFLLHMTRNGGRIGFSPGANPPMPYKLLPDEIAVLFSAHVDNVGQHVASKSALVVEREMTDIEKEVLDAINLARTKPLEIKKALEERMKLFDEDGNLCFEWGKVPTREGKAGYEEAIQFLDNQLPMQKVEISFGMNAIARTVSRSGGFRDSLEHATEKDIGKHGKASGYVEHIEYGPWKSGLDFVLTLIVDDGNSERNERNKMYQADLCVCGTCVATHQEYGKTCVINFATKFYELPSRASSNGAKSLEIRSS